MGRLVPLYTPHGTLHRWPVIYISDFSVPKWKSLFENEDFSANIIFSSPLTICRCHHMTTIAVLGGKSWNRVSPIISSLKLDRWVSTFFHIFLPLLSPKVTHHSIIGSEILTRPKTTTIRTFLKPVCELGGKKQKETVSDRARKWFLSAHNKGHIFCSLSYLDRSPERTVFVICGDELRKVRLCLVLFQLS